MTDAAHKPVPEAPPPAVVSHGHKNPPIGPKTGTPLQDWRKDRDYENFNPTPEK
jgi:hypothetical protein